LKDKHIYIPEDSVLLKKIYQEVCDNLKINKHKTAFLLTVKFIVYVSLTAAAYIGILYAENPVALFTFYILFGLIAVLFGFNFAHDFCHNTVFRNKRINNLCFTFIYTLVGAHAEAWKFRHIHSHHYAPNVKDYDTDLQITNLIRVEPDSPYAWYHRYQHYYAPLAYMTYSLYWVFIKDFVVYFTKKQAPENQGPDYHISFWLQKLIYTGYLLFIPLAVSTLAWWTILIAFLCMHAVQSLFLLFTFFMTHHVEATSYYKADKNGFITTSWFDNQVRSSNDFHPFSRTANFIFGGFNNHIAHHLFPHIHHVHYPSLNRILYRVMKSHHIYPNVTSFTGGIFSHLRHLKSLSLQK